MSDTIAVSADAFNVDLQLTATIRRRVAWRHVASAPGFQAAGFAIAKSAVGIRDRAEAAGPSTWDRQSRWLCQESGPRKAEG